MKYPSTLLNLIFKLLMPVSFAYCACIAAIVSLAPWDKFRILSNAKSKPSRITPPSRKNVGKSSANADFSRIANSSFVFIMLNFCAKLASNLVAIIFTFGNNTKKSIICRISRGVPRPANNRAKLRPTSGVRPNKSTTIPRTSAFNNKWPICS